MASNTSSSSQEALNALGQRLREVRLDAGLSGRDLSRLTGWPPSKVSKIENGRQAPSTEDVRQWCFHCRVPEQIPDFITSLRAVEGMFVEWRRMERTGLKQALESTVPLHEKTKRFRTYNAWLIPGILQTADYTKAVLSTIAGRRGVPDDSDEAVKVRLKRQQLTRMGDHRFAVIVEESVLYSSILSPELMYRQLEYVVDMSALQRVSLGVIPRSADRSSMWAVESFWIYDEDRVTVELVSGFLNLTRTHEVRMYAQAFLSYAQKR
ncbi:helix-turn-helix transcriptional regulator [Catellatospora sp. NPDC049111]|uniref:helix-turn-helix domain-containing protein n=1 Tax=Catellatospora sp. NPDC049111 TaxID=3155271 RepID=UPI003408EE96